MLPVPRYGECVEWVRHRFQMAPREMQIDGCVIERSMAEQYLNGAQVRAGFEQVCGIAMAQGLLVLLMICTQQKFAIGSIPCMASKLM
jgi:hypothetical protein